MVKQIIISTFLYTLLIIIRITINIFLIFLIRMIRTTLHQIFSVWQNIPSVFLLDLFFSTFQRGSFVFVVVTDMALLRKALEEVYVIA